MSKPLLDIDTIQRKKWLSTREATVYLDVHKSTLQDWRELHKLPYCKRGKVIRYKRADLDAFIEKGKVA
jgi:excisionase family DNA binding protein